MAPKDNHGYSISSRIVKLPVDYWLGFGRLQLVTFGLTPA